MATKFLSLYAPLVCSPRVFAALPPPCGQPRQFPVLITRSRHGGRPGQRLRSLSPDSCPRHTHTTTTTHRRTSRHNTQHTHSTSRPAPPGSFRRDSSLLSSASPPRACARASSRRTVVCKRNGWAATSAIGSWKFRIIPRAVGPDGRGLRLGSPSTLHRRRPMSESDQSSLCVVDRALCLHAGTASDRSNT